MSGLVLVQRAMNRPFRHWPVISRGMGHFLNCFIGEGSTVRQGELCGYLRGGECVTRSESERWSARWVRGSFLATSRGRSLISYSATGQALFRRESIPMTTQRVTTAPPVLVANGRGR